MTLGEAAKGTHLDGTVQPGKRAIKGEYRNAIVTKGGVKQIETTDLEAAYASNYPNDRHWDYAIGCMAPRGYCCCFVEAHPANTQHVEDMLDKQKATRARLKTDAPSVLQLAEATISRFSRPAWRWLATDARVDIHPNMPAARRLATAGIAMPARKITLP